MDKKAKKYHLEIRTNRSKPTGLLRRSIRDGEKVNKETLFTFTDVPLRQLQLIRASLQDRVVLKEEFKILASREFGASFACLEILKELGLDRAIYSRNDEWVKMACAMIVGRLVYAGSKLSLSNCGSYSALWDICGVRGDVDVNDCYDAMDKLFERQEKIQKTLANKHLENGTIVLYDITSCYMEGEYSASELVEFGYNRDKKRGKEQIIISLLCNKDGCPVAVEVLAGNTKDESTVLDKINEIGTKYGLEKVIFVGDRGMITQAKYEKIDHEFVKVVSALNHAKIKELCDKGTIQLSLFDEKNIVEIVDGNIRYMLCLNPEMAAKETMTRAELLAKTKEALDKIISSNRKTKNPKGVRAGKVVNKYKMSKFIIFEGNDDILTYRVDEEKIKQEAALDGCYIVFTDASKDDLSATETVKTYKGLIQVEQAFRNLKTATLEVRPIYHKTDERIKCHVFICMLSYYIMWHMKQRLEPLNKLDNKGKNRLYSFDYIIETLKSINSNTVEFMDVQSTKITTPNEEQSQFLKLLGVAL